MSFYHIDPTVYLLTLDLGSYGVSGGDLMFVQLVGGFSDTYGAPDDSQNSAVVYAASTDYVNNGYIIPILTGNTSLEVLNLDTPLDDNSDPNGDYGLNIFAITSGVSETVQQDVTVGATGSGAFEDQGGSLVVNTLTVSFASSLDVSAGGSILALYGLNVGGTTSGTLTVENGGTVASGGQIGIGRLGDGTVTIGNGGSIDATGEIDVAGNVGEGASTSELTIEDGGKATSGGVYDAIGDNSAGSGGTVTVTGPGSSWVLGAAMGIGNYGSGTLIVSDGGDVQTGGTYTTVGADMGANGVVSIEGPRSEWSLSSQLTAGNAGTANVAITDGGRLASGGPYDDLGLVAGGAGTVTVDGAGSQWTSGGQIGVGVDGDGTLTVSNDGSLDAAREVDVGENGGGGGIFIVESGGKATSRGTYDTIGGNAADADGTVTVTGSGSSWMLTAALAVGQSGAGELNIGSGGSIESGGTGYSEVAAVAGSDGTVSIDGANSTWNDQAPLSIGDGGTGEVTVQQGTLVASAAGAVAPTGLEVGGYHGGTGSLTVEDGGTIESDGTLDFVGSGLGSHGTVLIDGDGSIWKSDGAVTVGENGSGVLTVSNGGSFNAAGEIAVSRSPSSQGQLNIDSGGIATAGSVLIGATGVVMLSGGTLSSPDLTQLAGAILSGNGMVTGSIANDGTIIADGGTLTIAGSVSGSGTLDVAAGATLEIGGTLADTVSDDFQGAGELKLDAPLSANDVLTVGDGGTLDIAGDLAASDTIVFDGAGVLELDGGTDATSAAQLSLTSGQLTESATITTAAAIIGTNGKTIDGFAAGDTIIFNGQPNLTMSGQFNGTLTNEVDLYSGKTLKYALGFPAAFNWTTLEPQIVQIGGVTSTEIVEEPGPFVPLTYTTASQPEGSDIDWDFIDKNEGGTYLDPYVPTATSAVTVAIGVDLGTGVDTDQFDSPPLFPNWSSDPNLKYLYDAIGDLNGLSYLQTTGAWQYSNATYAESLSVNITQSQANQLTNFAQANILSDLIDLYEAKSGNEFSDLPGGVQTVLMDGAYNLGLGLVPGGKPGIQAFRFWKDALNLDLSNDLSDLEIQQQQLEQMYSDMLNVTTKAKYTHDRIVNDAQQELRPLLPSNYDYVSPTIVPIINANQVAPAFAFQASMGTSYFIGSPGQTTMSGVATVTLSNAPALATLRSESAIAADQTNPLGVAAYTLSAAVGSPLFASITLPGEGAAEFSVAFDSGGTWSAARIEQPGDTMNFAAGADGIAVVPLDADGIPTSLDSDFDFYFDVDFLSAGQFSGTESLPVSTWTWNGGSGASANATNWTLTSGTGNATNIPQPGDTLINTGGTIQQTDLAFVSNTLELGGTAGVAALAVAGDTTTTITNPSLDGASVITSAVPGNNTQETSMLNAAGTFVNSGTILADGPAGSTFTIDITGTTINGTFEPGYFFNPSLIEADAGNTLDIAIGATSELFNSGYIVADGGNVLITADPSAIAGGVAAVASFYVIKGGGTLETQASYPTVNGVQPGGSTPRYEFADATPGNTLKLDNLSSFGGSVIGFQAGDTVDLGTSIAVASLVYSTVTSLLEFENATGTILESLFLSTNGMTTGTFAVTGGTADGLIIGTSTSDGDTVVTTNRTFPNAAGVSGAWQNAASWNNGSIPAATDTAVLGLGETANFTLTTGSAPVSVLGISLFDPAASLQITSDTTATPGIANVYTGTLEVTGGNTLTSSALRAFDPRASILVDAGATVEATGRAGNSLAATAGTIAIEQSNSAAVELASGTMVIDGAVLAGPTTTSNGGNFTIGLDGAGTASVTVNGDGKAGDGVVTDTYTLLGSDPTSSGSLTLNGAGVNWTDTIDSHDTSNSRGYIQVGFNNVSSNTPAGLTPPPPAQSAQLLVENGATLTDQFFAQIGASPESSGNVTVIAGGFWNLADNGVGAMSVGYLGSGTLSVLNGGSVAIGNVGTFLSGGSPDVTGGIGIGRSIGANGTLNVNGANAQLSSLDGMSVGQAGQGQLNILNGGTVLIEGNGIGVGQTADASSAGTIDVGGPGAAAALDFTAASGSLAAASGMTVGNLSQGTLNVSDNGTINLNGTGGIGVGNSAGAIGVITVGGSTASAVINFTGPGMTVGESGTGSLTVNSLGTIVQTGTGGIGIVGTAGGSGVVTVDGGLITQGVSSSGIGVGNAPGGPASLLIENNGLVSLGGNWLGIANPGGSSGTVTVTGSGSSLLLSGTAGITDGNSGSGQLIVSSGGSIGVTGSGHITIGSNAGSSGQMTVNGGTVTFGASATGFPIGYSGSATLTVSNGGLISAGNGGMVIAQNSSGQGLVSVTSGAVSAGFLEVGQSGSGTLSITGGTVSTGLLGIGVNSRSSGTVTISAGASLTAGAIEVGEAGSGTLTVQGETLSTPSLGLGGSAGTPLGNAANRASIIASTELAVTGALGVWSGSTLTVDGTSGIDEGTSNSFVAGAINVESGHTLVGNGVVAAAVVNNGLIQASDASAPNSFTPGTLEIQGSITGAGVMQTGNGILRLDVAPPSGQTIQFGSGSELILNAPGAALANPITNLSDGDRIDLNLGAGVTITSASVTGPGTVTVLTNTGSYQLTDVGFAAGSGTSFFWGTDSSNGDDDIQVATPNINWTGAAGDTLFSDGGNWQGGLVPNATDAVNFVNNPGTVTGTGSVLQLNIGPNNQVNSGTWTFNNVTLTVSGAPNAPYPPYAVGFYAKTVLNGGTLNAAGGGENIGNVDGVTVTAQNGAKVTVLDDNIGTNPGQSGSLLLTGLGTTWTEQAGPPVNGYGVGYLTLGYNSPANGEAGGTGFLTVTNDAALNTGAFGNIGATFGSYGAMTVSAGGVWTASGGMDVGNDGTGILAVSGGTVNASVYNAIAQNPGSEGTVTVTNSGIFNAGTALNVGNQGVGTLTVSTGTVATTEVLAVGVQAGGVGVASLTNGAITASNGIQVGAAGSGTLTVNSGGTVQFGGTFNPVGANAGGSGTLQILNGGVATATQAAGSGVILQVGNSGASGTLAAAEGGILVSGTGSLLNLNGNDMTVGNVGLGTLSVTGGAVVDAGVVGTSSGTALSAGSTAGGDGQITVSGTKSTLNLGGSVGLGQAGSASLTVSSGGVVNITSTSTTTAGLGVGAGSSTSASNIGGQGDVDVTSNGTLTDESYITVGSFGENGVLNVSGGGLVSTVAGLQVGLGTDIGGTFYGGTGAVNIGAGGTLLVTEAPQTGNFAVQIGNTNSSVPGDGVATEASAVVAVSGGGAVLNTNNNPLEVGARSNGVLDVSQGGNVTVGTANTNNLVALSVGLFADGSLVLTDPGSLMTLDGGSYLGRAGAGSGLIENHASLVVDADTSNSGNNGFSIGSASGGNNATTASAQTGGSGDLQVTTSGDFYSLGTITIGRGGATGALEVNTGGTVEASQQIAIGTSETISAGGSIITTGGTTIVASPSILAGAGTVTVGAGGLLKADGTGSAVGTPDVIVGWGTRASGLLNVTGASAVVNTEGYQLAVGLAGQGSLLVSQGGTVLAGTPFASDEAIYAGGSAGATGAVTVTDPGSKLLATGQFAVGLGGQGSLLVENQGTVTSGDNTADATEGLDIAQDAGASGTVTVTGADSLLTNTGRFVVGDAGVGGLSVGSGGTVDTAPGTAPGLSGMVVGNDAGASGSSVDVSGTGSQLNVTGLLDVGDSGTGSLQIDDGATVTAGSLDAANVAAAVANVSVSGASTEFNVTGAATVADDGTGVLSVLDGATLTAASLTIGNQGDSSGAMVVSGQGNNVSEVILSGALNIGTAQGTGDLTVGPNATVLAGVVNLQGDVVLEGGFLDPTVYIENSGSTTSGFGTVGADYLVLEGTIISNGTKLNKQTEVVLGTVVGGGTLAITGGTTADGTTVNGPGILQIGTHDTIELTGAVLNAASTTFTDTQTPTGTYTVTNSVIDVVFQDTTGVLLLDDIAGFGGTIATYHAGDSFVITGGTLSNLGVSNGDTLTFSDAGSHAGADGIDQIIFASGVSAAGFQIVNGDTVQAVVPCFAEGTRIETDRGPVAVEDLRIGDRVTIADGDPSHEPIVWLGQRAVNCARHPRPETVWPVRVSAGAFGDNAPGRDLWLSPDHAVFVNGVLVPVKLLINGTSIAQVKRDRVRYFHVELPRHAVILAEGLKVESYLDVGDRSNFHRDTATVRLFPDFAAHLAPEAALAWETRGAAPLVMAGRKLAAARRLVAAPASQRGFSSKAVGTHTG